MNKNGQRDTLTLLHIVISQLGLEGKHQPLTFSAPGKDLKQMSHLMPVADKEVSWPRTRGEHPEP